MSQWTHVCGFVRVDFIDFSGEDPEGKHAKAKIEEALGPISTYGHRCETNAPCGSEGSLKWKILEVDGNYVNRFNIAIWGDLRDYGHDDEDIEKIKTWFKGVCEAGMMIRDAVLHIHVEFRKGVTLLYHHHSDYSPEYSETTENLYEPDDKQDGG